MKQNLRFILLMLLCVVCTGAWGEENTVTVQYTGSETTNMTGDNDAALVGLDNEKWSVVGYKGGVSFYPGLNKDGTIRLYYSESGNNTMVISSLENNTISSISITYSGESYNNGYVEVGGTRVTPEDGVYPINSTSFVVGSANTSNAQVRIKTIVINYISEKEEIAVPTFSPAGGTYSEAQTVTINCTTDGATIYYTLDGTDPDNGCDEYESPLTISETTTIKAIAVKGEESSGIASATYTIEQQVPAKPASLPFEFDGGKADIESTDGLTQNGLDSDYGSSPKLKFNSTGDWLLLQFDERPGKLTFDVKGNSFGNGSIFTVQTSEDGETFTDLKTYTDLGSTQSEEINNLGENVRYIKWVYTVKSSGNVALGNIKLEKYVKPTNYVLTITNVENATITATDADGSEITSGSEVLAGTDINLTVDVAEGYTLEALSVTKADESEVSVTKNDDSWSFTMPSSDVTVTCTLTKADVPTDNIYAKVTSNTDLTSGTYLIVYEEGSVALDGSLETLDVAQNTIAVTISNNEIQGTEAIDAATFTIDITEGVGSIKSASGYYIGHEGTRNTLNSSTETAYENTISVDEDGAEIAMRDYHLRYNATSGQERFRYFTSEQKAIQLYKLVEPENITLTISSVGYATLYYSNKNLVVPEGVVANTYKLNTAGDNVEILKSFNPGDVIPKDCGVVLEGTEGTFEFVESKANVESLEGNLLYGLDEGGTTVGPDGTTNYIFYMLSLDKNGENVGFYWKNGGKPFTATAHKAYLAIPKSSDINISSFSFDDLNGIKGIVSDSTTERGEVYTLSGMRMNGNQLPKGIYIVNGKKVVIK
ncbi:MAG: chitobiase/beta-hexosaminidase C-terminal domain-containing protein [Prevotella sp.]|nr:chitobiase/beta-hexosaminidase C-terminal domain-containing protein [Prevotella sp.]